MKKIVLCLAAALFIAAALPAEAFAALDFETLEPYIRSCGFYRMKGMHILEMSKILVEQYGGEVPQTREELTKLPGVGRKTANVVL